MADEPLREAERLAAAKQWTEAAELLRGAGDSDLVLERRAFYLSRAQRYPEAIAVLQALCERAPGTARYRYMLGYQFAQSEQFPAAIEHLRAATRIDPGYLKAHYRLAQAEAKAGHKVPSQLAAMQVLRLWEKADPDARRRDARLLARACYLLAKAQLRSDPSGSVELLRRALEHEPEDHNKHYLLGKALTRAGHPGEALKFLREAKRMQPRKSYIDLELVRALAESGEVDAARELLHATARSCRGWDAFNGARLALRLEDPGLARWLGESAERRGPARGDPRLAQLLAELAAVTPAPPSRAARADTRRGQRPTAPGPQADKAKAKPAAGSAVGEIVHLNPRRHFGFLVDEAGTKRHFRIKGPSELRKGGRVSFVPLEQEKGPAADDVRIAS